MDKAQLIALKDAPADAVMAGVLEGMTADDRNVRVAALRLLNHVAFSTDLDDTLVERGATAILRGLNDEKRRVREIAVQHSGPFRANADVVARLKEMVEDESEKRKIRSRAVAALAGGGTELPVETVKSIMADLPAVRGRLLLTLLVADLSHAVEVLLREFVEHGTKDEAVAATRALCGYQVVNLGAFEEEEKRREIARDHEAYGQAWFWMTRDDLKAYRAAPGA